MAEFKVGPLDDSTTPGFTVGPIESYDFVDALVAGWQQSATGLMVRGELPDTPYPPLDLNLRNVLLRGAATTTGIVADLPQAIVGAIGGAALGSAVAPGVGTVLGAGAGALALPSAMRGALIQAYQQGGVHSFGEALDVIMAFLLEGGKGAVLGAATVGAGRFVGQVVSGRTIAAVRNIAPVTAQIATLGSLGPALEGRVPTLVDFTDAAVIVGGLHTSVAVAGRLMRIYAKTGKHPAEVAAEALQNPELRAEITRMTADDIGIPKAYEALAAAENVNAAVPAPISPAIRARADEFMAQPFAETMPARPPIINFKYINTPEDFSGVAARLAEQLTSRIEGQTRGVVSHAKTLREAQEKLAEALSTSPDKVPLARKAGDAVVANELDARRILAVESLRELKELAARNKRAKEDGSLTDIERAEFYLHYERTAAILAQARGAGSEAGRALEILRRTSKALDEFKEVQKVVEEKGGFSKIDDLLEAISSAEDAPSLAAAVKKANKVGWFRKFIEIWKAGLVSGLSTHEANLLGGSFAGFVVQFLERPVAAAIGETRRAVFGAKDFVSARETMAFYYGAAQGARASLAMAAKVLADEKAPTSSLAVRVESKVEALPGGAVQGRAGEVVRVPFRFLSAEDALIRGIAEYGELPAQSIREAYRRGLDPRSDAFKRTVEGLIENKPEPQTAAAIKAGHEAVFTTPLGAAGKTFEAWIQKFPVVEFPLPFRRTPINITKWFSYRFPGLGLFTPKMWADLKAGGAARDIAIARQLVGTGLAFLAWKLVKDGEITGGFQSLTDEERNAKYNNGEQPYSVKMFGTWISYTRLDPVAPLFKLVADFAELSDRTEQLEDRGALFVTTAALFGNALVSQTYLKGLNDMFKGLTQTKIYGERWYQSLLGSLVPGFVSQFVSAHDPHVREVNTGLEAIANRLPILREQLRPRVNPLTGQPVANRAESTIFGVPVPSAIHTADPGTDAVAAEAARLGFAPEKQQKTLAVGGALSSKKMIDGRLVSNRIRLTPEEVSKITELTGKGGHELMAPIVASPGWPTLPEPVKLKQFRDMYAVARRMAIMQSLDPVKRADALNAALQTLSP